FLEKGSYPARPWLAINFNSGRGYFMENYKYAQFKKPHRILLVVAIILIASNLRPAITSVGPIIDLLRESLSLSNFSIGILTSLPLIAFGIMSPIVPKISMKYTNETTMIAG